MRPGWLPDMRRTALMPDAALPAAQSAAQSVCCLVGTGQSASTVGTRQRVIHDSDILILERVFQSPQSGDSV